MPQKTNNPEKKQTEKGMTLSSASVSQEQRRAMAGRRNGVIRVGR